MAASPLPSPCPQKGRKCIVTPAISRVPNAKRGEQNQNWLPHPYLLGGQKTAEMLPHPCTLRSPQRQARGAKSRPKKRAEMLCNPGILGGSQRQAQETGSELVASPLPVRRPRKGRKCYVTPVVLGVPILSTAFVETEMRAEKLRHPCILRGLQRQARGAKSEVGASPRPSWGPKRGQKCYATHAFSEVPNAKRREQNERRVPQPCLLGAPNEGTNATSPLHSRRCPMPSAGSKIIGDCLTPAFSRGQKRAEMLRHPCILGGPQCQERGAKSEVVASPLPSWGPKRGRKCYVTPAFSGVPNAKHAEQNQKWLPHPCLLGGPKEGGNATSPLHSRGSPTPSAGSKIRSGCLTPAFLGAQNTAEMLRYPCILGGPQRQARGAKSQVPASTLPSGGPGTGRKCYTGEQNQKWLPHPSLLGGPKEGGNATLPRHSRESPTPSAGSKIRSGCLTPAFLGAQKRAEMLRYPCILGGPQRQARGAKSEVAASARPSWGPKRGQKCYVTPAFSGLPNAKRGEQNHRCVPQPCLPGGPEQGGNATRGAKSEVVASPQPSWGPKRGRKWYVTPAFSGVPNAKRGEQNQKWLPHSGLLGGPKQGGNATLPLHSRGSPTPSAGSKITGACLNPAFRGAQNREEMLHGEQNQKWLPHPGLLGGPKEGGNATLPRRSWGVPNAKRGEQNQKWLPHPGLLGGPKEGGNATLPLHSRGSPTASVGSKIRSGCLTPAFLGAQNRAKMLRYPCILGGPQCQAWGAKSQVPASTLPSGGPRTGRKCYTGSKIRSGCLTPAFLGAQKRAEMLRHPGILGGPQRQARGAKSEVVASPRPSWGPKRGRKCYLTPAFSGVPNAKRGEQNQKWLPHPCLLGGPKEGGNATSPLHSRGCPMPSAGSKIIGGCLNPAFLGAQNREEMLRYPCILGAAQRQAQGAKSELGCLIRAFPGAQKRAELLRHPGKLRGRQRGAQRAKSEVATLLLPSMGPKRGWKCYVTFALSGVANTKRGEQNQKWLPHPGLLGGPKEGGNVTLPLHSRGSPMPSVGSKIISDCLTSPFLEAQKRAEMLRHPCILGGPQCQARGAKSEVVASPLPSWRPK